MLAHIYKVVITFEFSDYPHEHFNLFFAMNVHSREKSKLCDLVTPYYIQGMEQAKEAGRALVSGA